MIESTNSDDSYNMTPIIHLQTQFTEVSTVLVKHNIYKIFLVVQKGAINFVLIALSALMGQNETSRYMVVL